MLKEIKDTLIEMLLYYLGIGMTPEELLITHYIAPLGLLILLLILLRLR